MAGGAEARRTPRRIYQRPIGILHRGVYRVAQGQQLSEGGLLFNSFEKFAVHDQIVASLVMPGGDSVVVRGQIIYERPSSSPKEFQYGVKFADLPLQQRRLIRNYVGAKTQAEAEQETVDASRYRVS